MYPVGIVVQVSYHRVFPFSDNTAILYCWDNPEERHIYDMAVLQEYHKDRNASSAKLFLEINKEIMQQGGEWTLEARETTTYRYMKTMEERGLIKMATSGVDHTMSDGSKVYNVKFSPIDRKQQSQAQTKVPAKGQPGKKSFVARLLRGNAARSI